MTLWMIIPRDPLIFRDGKPFTNSPGSRARTVPFPFPATIAGAVRTQAGIDLDTGRFDKNRIPELLQKSVRGPFLVELSEEDKITDWIFPAPADAVMFNTDDKDEVQCNRLAPIELSPGTATDLQGHNLVAFSRIIKDKPHPRPPRFWLRGIFEHWLLNPTDGRMALKNFGLSALATDSRTHVSISPNTLAAHPGALFQTAGLEFDHLEADNIHLLSKVRRLGLAVDTDATLPGGTGFLGGERRIAHWKIADTSLPECPHPVKQRILEQRACRLILLTPAFFTSGYLPEWLKQGFGFQVDVKAAVVNRYQTISGWDYAFQQGKQNGRPKPTRRLVPAGSVYFLKLNGDQSQIEKFIDEIWMNAISDDPQSRLDGFGIAVLGSWDGLLRKMEAQS